MFSYRKFFSMHRAGKVPDAVPGCVFPVDDWTRLDRFLTLGSEAGSYSAAERPPARENTDGTVKAIKKNGEHAVARIAEVSLSRRAPRNDPAIFALALAASLGNDKTKRAVTAAIPKVCRTAGDLFQFARETERLGVSLRELRRGIAAWYTGMSVDQLAMQMVTYQPRGGWGHRELLRLAQPWTAEPARKALLEWIRRGVASPALPRPAAAYVSLQKAKVADEAAAIILKHGLPPEAAPPVWQDSPKVWRAFLAHMPVTALLSNLGKLTSMGILTPTNGLPFVLSALSNSSVKAAHIQPLTILFALKAYAQGHGEKGTPSWEPVPQIAEALNNAFTAAFANVEPTRKRVLLALDVSGSMATGGIAGTPLSARDASAAMALITAATEKSGTIAGFTAADTADGCSQHAVLRTLPFSRDMRLDDAVRVIENLPFGGTDWSLPILCALEQRIGVDAFVVYTDNDTWPGRVQPADALRAYRSRTGIPAKLAVVGVGSSGFAIADPDDGGMLDVIGFDAAAPGVIADFIRA